MTLFSGIHLVYLPAYSPDFNPIEEGFSAMKAWVRRNTNRVQTSLEHSPRHAERILRRAVLESMTAEKAVGWFHHSGYL
jgi:transposase